MKKKIKLLMCRKIKHFFPKSRFLSKPAMQNRMQNLYNIMVKYKTMSMA